jgi:hypothetical protein
MVFDLVFLPTCGSRGQEPTSYTPLAEVKDLNTFFMKETFFFKKKSTRRDAMLYCLSVIPKQGSIYHGAHHLLFIFIDLKEQEEKIR